MFFETEPDHVLSVRPPLVFVVVYTFLARLVLASVSSCAKMRSVVVLASILAFLASAPALVATGSNPAKKKT